MDMHHHTVGKVVAWSIVTVVFGVFFFYVLERALDLPMQQPKGVAFLIQSVLLPIILFSGFLASWGIHAMISRVTWLRYLVPVVIGLSLFLFFSISQWSVIAAALFVGALIGYHYAVQQDMTSRISVRVVYSLASGLGLIISVSLIAISVLYYHLLIVRPNSAEELRSSMRDSIVNSSIKLIGTRVEGFAPDVTLDDVIANVITGRLKIDLIPELTEISNEQGENQEVVESLRRSLEKEQGRQVSDQEVQDAFNAQKANQQSELTRLVDTQLGEAERQLIADVRNQLVTSLGIEAKGDDTIKDVLTKIVDKRVIAFVEPYLKFAPLVLSVSLFFLLYIFSFLYRYLTRGFGLLWYGILKGTHFIRILEEDVKAKRITLD